MSMQDYFNKTSKAFKESAEPAKTVYAGATTYDASGGIIDDGEDVEEEEDEMTNEEYLMMYSPGYAQRQDARNRDIMGQLESCGC